MIGYATMVMAWQEAPPGVIADVLRRAGKCVEIIHPRDGQRSELTITAAPRP
jgi:hypothetical protein